MNELIDHTGYADRILLFLAKCTFSHATRHCCCGDRATRRRSGDRTRWLERIERPANTSNSQEYQHVHDSHVAQNQAHRDLVVRRRFHRQDGTVHSVLWCEEHCTITNVERKNKGSQKRKRSRCLQAVPKPHVIHIKVNTRRLGGDKAFQGR